MKSEKIFEISDFQISRGGLAALITRTGQIYTWGPNELGSLGHGDSQPRQTPTRIKTLEEKKVTAVGLGDDFAIALGLTLPFTELRRIMQQSG